VYDSYGSSGGANWLVFGGTSVASPIIASVYALAGNATIMNYGSNPYSHTGSLFDVTTGSNGGCSYYARYLCTARAGYDGPTGLGTPNGTGAF
jgi:subtilase family serine protease